MEVEVATAPKEYEFSTAWVTPPGPPGDDGKAPPVPQPINVAWSLLVRPADVGDRLRAARAAELPQPEPVGEVEAQLFYYELGRRCVVEIRQAKPDDGDVLPINGKPATDPAVRDLVLRASRSLAIEAGSAAEAMGILRRVRTGN